jgi:sulfate permease, SulP family
LVLSIVLTTLLGLAEKGVAILGPVPTGVPMPSLPTFPLGDLFALMTGGAGLVFLALGESIGAARTFASRHGYRIDPDQELVAMGASNLSTGLFGGFSVDASLSQSATGEAAGNRSQLASLVTAGLLLATALYLAPLFTNLPQAVLAAIIIGSVLGLVDIPEFRRYVDQRRTDFALSLVACIGVLTTSVLTGLAFAALVSIVLLLYRASQPAVTVMGRIPGTRDGFGDLGRYAGAWQVPGVLALRLDTPLYYFNANDVEMRVLTMIETADPRPQSLVLDIGATGDIDVTTADMLRELLRALADLGVSLSLAQAKGRVRDRMVTSGLMDAVGADHVFPTVSAAVAAASAIAAEPSLEDLVTARAPDQAAPGPTDQATPGPSDQATPGPSDQATPGPTDTEAPD